MQPWHPPVGLGQGTRLRILCPKMVLRSDVLPRFSVQEMLCMVGIDRVIFVRHSRPTGKNKLISLNPICSRPVWTGLWAPGLAESVSAHGRGLECDGFSRSLTNQTIPWFCDSVLVTKTPELVEVSVTSNNCGMYSIPPGHLVVPISHYALGLALGNSQKRGHCLAFFFAGKGSPEEWKYGESH